MSEDEDARKKMADIKSDMAKKKSKLTVPTEFLDNAKSYDDKLMMVKVLSEREKQRVVLLFKKMIQSGIEEKERKKGLK
jgi:hypothetical protein